MDLYKSKNIGLREKVIHFNATYKYMSILHPIIYECCLLFLLNNIWCPIFPKFSLFWQIKKRCLWYTVIQGGYKISSNIIQLNGWNTIFLTRKWNINTLAYIKFYLTSHKRLVNICISSSCSSLFRKTSSSSHVCSFCLHFSAKIIMGWSGSKR